MFLLIPKWIVNDARRQQIAVNGNCYKHINNIIVIFHENPFAFMWITQFIILLADWEMASEIEIRRHGKKDVSESNQNTNWIESDRIDLMNAI